MRTDVGCLLTHGLVSLLLLFIIEITSLNSQPAETLVFNFFFLVFYLFLVSLIYGVEQFVLYTWIICCIKLSILFYLLEHFQSLKTRDYNISANWKHRMFLNYNIETINDITSDIERVFKYEYPLTSSNSNTFLGHQLNLCNCNYSLHLRLALFLL